jgi:anti-sigma B factor antagonist
VRSSCWESSILTKSIDQRSFGLVAAGLVIAPFKLKGRRSPVSIDLSTRQLNGITIVDLKGRITLGEGSVTVRNTVHDLLAKGQKRILLNNANYIDSSGIGELVSAFTAAKKQGGELKLLNLTKKIHDSLQITKLYTVFDVKDDEALAVGSFGK